MKKKIYCFVNVKYHRDLAVAAICEDGEVLAQHISSSKEYGRINLGFSPSTRKHANYNDHCGVGNWELEWVDDVENHLGIQSAFALHREKHDEQEAKTLNEKKDQ